MDFPFITMRVLRYSTQVDQHLLFHSVNYVHMYLCKMLSLKLQATDLYKMLRLKFKNIYLKY
jgi:hypothetical protein